MRLFHQLIIIICIRHELSSKAFYVTILFKLKNAVLKKYSFKSQYSSLQNFGVRKHVMSFLNYFSRFFLREVH